MQKFYQRNNDNQNSQKAVSYRTPNRDNCTEQFNSYSQSKYKLNSKNYAKSPYSKKQTEIHHRSQRYFKSNSNQDRNQTDTKILFPKHKIYKSYSEVKHNKYANKTQKQQFLIRIPKDENIIQNYIQQLKQLKRKIAEQRKDLTQYKKQGSSIQFQKKQQFNEKNIYKQQNQIQSNRVKFQKQDNSITTPLKNAEMISKQYKTDKRMFSRDLKKHKTKLKIVKEFIDQNECSQAQQKQIKNQQNQQNNSQSYNYQNIEKFKLNEQKPMLWPKKIVYGDIYNVKQQFRIQNPFKQNKFNRYSSQSGRKLYTMSKSIDLRKNSKQKINTQSKQQKFPNSKSLVLRRRKTQNDGDLKQLNSKQQIIPHKSMKDRKLAFRQKAQKLNQNSQIFNQKSNSKSPIKNKNKKISPKKIKIQQSEAELKNPFKSIEGCSTIQDKKQTLDILGQSCMQIKQNLISSNKKMNHILDLLGYDTGQIKQSCRQKQRRRKMSYQRFSKAFPKGFFK